MFAQKRPRHKKKTTFSWKRSVKTGLVAATFVALAASPASAVPDAATPDARNVQLSAEHKEKTDRIIGYVKAKTQAEAERATPLTPVRALVESMSIAEPITVPKDTVLEYDAVDAKNVVITPAPPKVKKVKKAKQFKVTVDGKKVWRTWDIEKKPMVKLDKGDIVTITHRTDTGLAKVKFGKKTGFVKDSGLKVYVKPKPVVVETTTDATSDATATTTEPTQGATGSAPAQDNAPQVTAVPAGEAQQIAHEMVIARGWSEDDFKCLVDLWTRESNWNASAENPSSGAYGIPQSLPGSKMASAGADWRTNARTQITWGLGYIGDRYGTPCGAWSHSEQVGWY